MDPHLFDFSRQPQGLIKFPIGQQTGITGDLRAVEFETNLAVAIDPQYEQAWAALADTYALIPEYRAGPITEFVLLARQAADQALSRFEGVSGGIAFAGGCGGGGGHAGRVGLSQSNS